jgi:hypothetical protein
MVYFLGIGRERVVKESKVVDILVHVGHVTFDLH